MKPLKLAYISYLIARPSRDLIVAAHQELTREWWESGRMEFDSFVSELVIRESGAGDLIAAGRRLTELAAIPVLALTDEAVTLARDLIEREILPKAAADDAMHIGLATVHAMDYLLTWNCRHIANARIRPAVTARCVAQGYTLPIICTPEELMGGL